MQGVYSTDPGFCRVDNHPIKGRQYRGLKLARWEGDIPIKTRACKEHYLEEWAEVYPGQPLPDLSPQPSILGGVD